MLILFTKLLNVKSIKNILKLRKVRYISSCRKENLLFILNMNQCSRIIQRKFREKIKFQIECPISHEKLIYPFVSFKISDKFFYYDFETIVNYFNKTRDFRDPLTRTIISDYYLENINSLISYYYSKNSNKIIFSDTMIKNTELNIITFCLNDLVNEINLNYKITFEDIYNNFLPRIIYYMHKLKQNHEKSVVFTLMIAFKENIKKTIINIESIIEYIELSLLF
jgi:hypothetical protein